MTSDDWGQSGSAQTPASHGGSAPDMFTPSPAVSGLPAYTLPPSSDTRPPATTFAASDPDAASLGASQSGVSDPDASSFGASRSGVSDPEASSSGASQSAASQWTAQFATSQSAVPAPTADDLPATPSTVGYPTSPPSWNQPGGTPGVTAPATVSQPYGGFGDPGASRSEPGASASESDASEDSQGTGASALGGGLSGSSAGPTAQVSTPPGRPTTYGSGSSSFGQPMAQQRGEGMVYAAQSPADMTMPIIMNPVENSGSLTGHILAQGWDRGEDTGRRSNVKVGIAMLVVLLLLVGVSLVFLFTAGETFTDMLNGMLGNK